MQVVVRSGAGERDVDLELRNPEATLGDLARALGGGGDRPVTVAGRRWPPDCRIADAGLTEGGLVQLGAGGAFVPPPPAGRYEVAATAGLDAGGTWPFAGRVLVGRGSAAQVVLDDPTVSREHCTLALGEDGRLLVTDVGARNAVLVDDRVLRRGGTAAVDPTCTVRLGAVDLLVRPRRDDDRPRGLDVRRQVGPAGTLPFNRPPRPAPPPAPHVLPLPQEPAERSSEPLSVAALVGPLVLAAVMVLVTGDPRFALFSALSPVLAVGTWYESRRRSGRTGRRERSRYDSELAALADRLREGAAEERVRLRAVAPDPAEVLRRAALPSTRLWERRPGSTDFLRLAAGTADQSWQPPVELHARPAPAVAALLAASRLPAAPVVVDLSGGGVVGVVGDRAAALAVARALLCAAAVGSGPADVTVGVFVDPGREEDWDWCKWLPHTMAAAGGVDRWLSADRDSSEQMLRALGRGAAAGTALVVLDTAVLTTGKNAPARDLLSLARRPAGPGGSPPPVAGIVVARAPDALPAACNQVLVVRADGTATLSRLDDGGEIGDVLAGGLSPGRARGCARDLARFDDPELTVAGAGLPVGVRLLPLLELERTGNEIDVDAVRKRWRAAGPDPGAIAPLGVTENGLFVLDLVRDGAHGLIGGTTGSGKSELLRSLVAGLAVHADAEHLTFVLVDYKGGAAFDVCARLPHVVGLVTDLDEQLGERALRALEAELHSREHTLRAAGADSLADYLALGLPDPLPRLVVVIDEFATLAKELPDFVASLVGIAQRGRTLGVHLLLATQRPSGAVNDNIKANTNLRIALRVQDGADSSDVIGTPAAAQIGRDRPGRAYVRLGPGEVVPIQTALVTCVSDAGADEPVSAAPFGFGPRSRAARSAGTRSVRTGRSGGIRTGEGRAEDRRTADEGTGGGARAARARTDLARLVDALVAAHAAEGFPPPRRPWPEPLPGMLDLAGLVARGPDPEVAVVALADDPAGQAQHPVGWELSKGGLLLLGVPGSGTTTALLSLALSLAARRPPDALELYALDFGVGDLAVLEALPHTGAVVQAPDRERQVRLLRRLRSELDRRRGLPRGTALTRTVVLLDNLAAMRAAYDDVEGLELMDLLARVHADGPEVGITLAITADRPAVVPLPIASVTTQKWLFRLADAFDYSAVGLSRTDVPAPVPGRAVLLPSRLQAQLGLPAAGLVAEVAARWVGSPQRARPVAVLPARVSSADLGRGAHRDGEAWRVPVGIAEADLSVAELALYEGDCALVTGPARSGKSGVLWSLAEVLRAGGLYVVASGGRRSPLAGCPALHRWVPASQVGTVAAELRRPATPTVLLLDDAEGFDDDDSALAALVTAPGPALHVVAAGRSDTLRTLYAHWTTKVRRSKTGLLLRPSVDLDGDLLGATLPRRAPVALTTARGYLVADGGVALVQAATMPMPGARG